MIVSDFQQLASGVYLEGLGVDTATGTVWYSDVIAGGLHRIAPDGTKTSFGTRMWTGGVMMNHDGKVLSSGQGGIQWTDPATGADGWLVDGISGINEMVADGRGGLIFGTVDLDNIVQGKEAQPSGIYRLNPDRSVTPLAEGVGFVNGIQLSADGARLFYSQTFDGVYAYDIGADGGLSNRTRLLAKFDSDGMAMDADGTMWVTGFQSDHFVRLRPDGTLLDPFMLPVGAVTQLRFGGADSRDIWFTAVPPEAADDLKEGRVPAGERSVLYRGRADRPGAPMLPAQFDLG